MSPPVLDLPVGANTWVFQRNDHGTYEYVFGYLTCRVYRNKAGWEASVSVGADDQSLKFAEQGYGKTATAALHDALRALRPIIDTMAFQVLCYRDFTRGLS